MGEAVASTEALQVNVGPEELGKGDRRDVTILQKFNELQTSTLGDP